jgi:hypothetical protein
LLLESSFKVDFVLTQYIQGTFSYKSTNSYQELVVVHVFLKDVKSLERALQYFFDSKEHESLYKELFQNKK